jgi:hypothetical protein
MDGILDKVHEAGLTLKAGCGIGYEFSTLRPRGAFVAGAGAYTSGPMSFMDIYDKMCFTVSSAGGRRGAQMGTFDVSHPGREGLHPRQARRRPPAPVQPVAADHRRLHGRGQARRDWPLVFPVNDKEQGDIDLADAEQVVWREWPTHSNYIVRDDGLVRLQDLRPHPRAAPVGHDHGLDVRLRRAGLHPDRPRQRDEQQLVVRDHPRDQPLRRAAAAAVRRLPAGLGQPHQVRAQALHRRGLLRLGGIQGSRARVHPHARQRGRSERPAAGSSSATRSCASAATAWASSAWAAP